MSSQSGPIVIVEDDEDDQMIFGEVIADLNIPNEVKFFSSGNSALDYLINTNDSPFLIISDINLPGMDGRELRRLIFQNEYLRKKSIPFVYVTTATTREQVAIAYEMMVQGFFIKPNTIEGIRSLLNGIITYWTICLHPNR